MKVWVGTYAGLFEFEQETGKFDPVPFIPDSQDTSFKLHLITIFEDLDGTILFGTQLGFLSYNEDKRMLIPSYPFFNAKANLKWLDISPDPIQGENILWVTHGKLFKYNKKTGKRTYFLPEADDPNSILGQVIYSIYFDETRMMWAAGTRGVNILNPESDQIKKFEDQSLKSEVWNYPNPFTNSTTIEYELNQPETVRITFYNQFGKQVDVIEQNQLEGLQQVIWTPENLAEGIYYFRLQAGEQVATGKVVLAR